MIKRYWKFNIRFTFVLLLFSLLASASEPVPISEKQEAILKTVLHYVSQKHVSPKAVDDEFSAAVWEKYLEYIDIKRQIFLKSDIEALEKYKFTIDDEIKSNSLEFFEASTAIYNRRIQELDALCKTLLKKPFSFDESETLANEHDYPKDAQARKELWRKKLKHRVLVKYTNLSEREETKSGRNAIDRKLEKESRADIQKWMQSFFERMLRPEEADNKFSYFINAILFQVDPHSIYYAPQQAQTRTEGLSKRFFGIGVALKEVGGEYFVESVLPGGSSYDSGLIFEGDQILQVENSEGEMQAVFAMPTDAVVSMVRGDENTTVRMLIKRKNQAAKIIELTRKEFKDKAKLARSAIVEKGANKIGVIYLPDFYVDVKDPNGAHASTDVIALIEQLKKENVSGIVIDLRNNPGGSMDEVVKLAGALIGKGPKVQLRSRYNQRILQTNTAPIYTGPLAVMINERSASASELFAAAIQDYQRGVIIGGPTSFGKGSAQETLPIGRMADVSKNRAALNFGAVSITTFMFYRVTGKSNQKGGVIPDIVLPSPSAFSSTVERDYKSALVANPINAAPYTPLPRSVDFDALNQIKNKPVFQRIERLAKEASALEKAPVPLSLSAYNAYLEQIKAKKDMLKDALSLSDSMRVQNIADASIASEKWHLAWLDEIAKDLYLSEAIQILQIISEQDKEEIEYCTLTLEALKSYFKDEDSLPQEQLEADFIELRNLLNKDIGEKALLSKLKAAELKKDTNEFNRLLETDAVDITKKRLRMKQGFVREHPDSFVSLYLLSMESTSYTTDGYAKAYHALNQKLKATKTGKKIGEDVRNLDAVSAGALAIDFVRKDKDGRRIQLSDFRGKYVLLDFWGSWCKPCRQSHPHLKELYSKYKDKGFEIIAVAHEKGKTLEARKKPWLAAIEADKIPWIHVLNADGTGAPSIFEAYKNQGFPTKILIDKEGRILMRVMSNMNEEMDVLLEQIFN